MGQFFCFGFVLLFLLLFCSVLVVGEGGGGCFVIFHCFVDGFLLLFSKLLCLF